jgi:Mg-chelatase subunit ChlI
MSSEDDLKAALELHAALNGLRRGRREPNHGHEKALEVVRQKAAAKQAAAAAQQQQQQQQQQQRTPPPHETEEESYSGQERKRDAGCNEEEGPSRGSAEKSETKRKKRGVVCVCVCMRVRACACTYLHAWLVA